MGFDTQSMPSLARLSGGQLPPQLAQSLMQLLGNCAQPITHRGNVTIQPGLSLYHMSGVYGAGPGGGYSPGFPGQTPWNPADFAPILPGPGGGSSGGTFVDVPGFSRGPSNFHSYGGDTFNLPISQAFNTYPTYGGPTFQVGGAITFGDAYGDNITVNNIDARTINNNPPGQSGQAGPAGPAGSTGAAGIPGLNGTGGFGVSVGPAGAPGAAGIDGFDGIANNGLNGFNGANGFDGFGGARGRDGRRGRMGIQGRDGVTTIVTLPGFPGPPGNDGDNGYAQIPEFELTDDCQIVPKDNIKQVVPVVYV
jgi:hypothetical protein